MELLRILSYPKNPFLFHAILEIPASLNYFLNPSGQLGIFSPQAHAVIRQYAVLLLSSVLVALLFASRDQDELSGQIAGALAVYHLAPMVRAMGRLGGKQGKCQPLLFLTLHGMCLAGLTGLCWDLCLGELFSE